MAAFDIRSWVFLALLFRSLGLLQAQTDGLYWIGGLAYTGRGMLTTDGRMTYHGSGYGGPYYFATADANGVVESITRQTLVGRSSVDVGDILLRDGSLLRALGTVRPGTNIPEAVLSFTDSDHAVQWTKVYTLAGYRGSAVEAALGWEVGDDMLIQITFLDSNNSGSARKNALLKLDRSGEVIWAKTVADPLLYQTLNILAGGDLLFGRFTVLTRTDSLGMPIWSKSYASGTEHLHYGGNAVDVAPSGAIRMVWNMGDTTFHFPSGGLATWPAYAGLLSVDPSSGDLLNRRRLDQNKPFKVHGIAAVGEDEFMLFGSYNTLRPYQPARMRVHGQLTRVSSGGAILAVDTFHYGAQLRSSEIVSFEVFDGRAVMSINLSDGPNPSRYLAVMPLQGQALCELYPSAATISGTVQATATDRPLWQPEDVQVQATTIDTEVLPIAVDIVRVCPMITTGSDGTSAPSYQLAWPNPASDRLIIAVGSEQRPVRATVVSVTGAAVEVPLRSTADGVELDVHQLSSGAYVVRLDDGSLQHGVRFIKE